MKRNVEEKKRGEREREEGRRKRQLINIVIE